MVSLRDAVDEDERRPDLTPLIDIVFLLLVFLLLTTDFVAPERVIHQLLPTDQGPSQEITIIPETEIHFAVHPAGISRDMELAALHEFARSPAASRPGAVVVRCLDRRLVVDLAEPPERRLERIHGFVDGLLADQERPGHERAKQMPVVIHCYSGLAWSHALAVFDAAREYEGRHGRPEVISSSDWARMRELSLASPPQRDYDQRAWVHELRRLLVVR